MPPSGVNCEAMLTAWSNESAISWVAFSGLSVSSIFFILIPAGPVNTSLMSFVSQKLYQGWVVNSSVKTSENKRIYLVECCYGSHCCFRNGWNGIVVVVFIPVNPDKFNAVFQGEKVATPSAMDCAGIFIRLAAAEAAIMFNRLWGPGNLVSGSEGSNMRSLSAYRRMIWLPEMPTPFLKTQYCVKGITGFGACLPAIILQYSCQLHEK